ncbi:high affinity glucose transporter [Exophiala dermatitidis]|uniref:MFS transporter, SP family, sugar:H+ symporter n=2 Tax=Exophiala dermatitidis TaxID=5970 RepID=H6C2B4_EXODN|nr:MFS transporter, SP family, sugar:H+ symporter [Exophiala dermatitidis NIH/UT8656]KAJ4512864.1 high affinity glucose transporter [Exophiala dermatitidis]EHY57886.1 MFS transporter, SP family, sugar:H+ symporter [Exophiala dermatitidis NIH/UT8656]KAJ4515898.1 high affinity glucose transporter [Exophiala dermatitidis]KAJ4518694.1 high affinity glucose transporter [Exophiala dermatitidis]KAJ4534207.1 high affinity glucose transporter [Exophiala dermatitidis]
MYEVGNIYFITAIAVIGGGLFGFDISSMSAILGTSQYKCYFNEGHGPPDCSGPHSDTQGGITASMPGGSFVGALASGFLSDIFGRKRAIQIGAVIWCIGCIIVCAAQNIGMLVAGRFINGFSVGICSAQVPVYVSELAPPSKRGRVVGAQQWAITWGILIMFYISYGCSFIDGNAAFRVPWGLQMIPAIILFFGLFFLPESPRWLARNDRWEECHGVLALVHAKGDRNNRFVLRELQEIKDMCEFERRNADVTYLELFKPNMIWRTHIGVFTQIWSQLTGMNVMMYYITYVFGMAGLTGNTNLVASSIQYVINVFMTIFALMFIDRWGRRWPLLVGSTFMATWMFANAGLMASYGSPAPPGGVDHVEEESWQIHGGAAKGVIACTYLFVASFAPTWGPVSWIYPPELYPLRIRGKAVALTTSANWIFNFALSYFVPPAFVNIKWKVYIVFGIFCTAMTIHVFFCFPETAGKTLEEVEEIFLSNIKPWNTHVDYKHVIREEHGEVDPEKRLSFAVQHHERDDSDGVDVARHTEPVEKNQAV